MPIERQPPPIEQIAQRLATRMARDGIRIEQSPFPAVPPKDEDRRQRSLRSCHLPAEPKPQRYFPRDSGAYVPEMAARIEDDPNLTDGARRCARKLAEYTYHYARDTRMAQITVTYMMKALGKSRRTVQRYLRQLEYAGYISVEIIHASTRMCAGLFVALLAPLFPRHHRQKWPRKLIDSDVPRESQNNRLRIKYGRESWALRCMDGVFRSFMKTIPPFPSAT
ncbi:MAG: HTH domain-containing protein [Candidatus Acidiferrales bacterium]